MHNFTNCTTLALSLVVLASGPARAAGFCVNPGGTAGCYSSIGAAVAAAPSGGVIQVAAGVYKESVAITKTILLVGDSGMAVIDAGGKSTGIFVNGTSSAPSPGLSGLVISGLTVKNANFEGILVANTTGITITGNTLLNNNLGLVPGATATCPNLPAFETNEGEDCGEALHLMAVDHSIISNNDIESNAGGILISDETGSAHDNVIVGNNVSNNAYDCGITIASHGRAPSLPPGPSYGVFHNTVSRNVVRHNGSLGQGAGVGIYAPGPGSSATGNVVIDNLLTDNGLGGVTMHIHAAPGVGQVPAQAPPVNLSDNVIVGNHISGNLGDVDDPSSTPAGPTGISIVTVAPISGTMIAGNTFSSEGAGIVFNAPAGTVFAHLNNFSPNSNGVVTEGPGYVDASQNWWGCPAGPGAAGCASTAGSSVWTPSWLQMPFGAPQVRR